MKTRFLFPVLLLTIPASISVAGTDTCLLFQAPAVKSIVSAPSCTLGVESFCRKIKKTEISVCYFPEHSDTPVVSTIGVINRPPFKQIWNLSNIPNQLGNGIGIAIVATFFNGEVSKMHREGIFLAHQPIRNPGATFMRYEIPGTAYFPKDTLFFPASASSSSSVFVQRFWNERDISFKITVVDTSFRSATPDSILRCMGVEVMIDPARKSRPYPTDDIKIFMIPLLPLTGNPSLLTYELQFNDSGRCPLTPRSAKSNASHSITLNDRGGFSVILSIPQFIFGKTPLTEMGFNSIVKSTDGRGGIVTSSLIGAEGYNNLSPLLWTTISIAPKPVAKTRWIILLVSFIAGLAIPLFFYFVFHAIKHERPRTILAKRIPDENRQFEKIKEIIEQAVTRKDISLAHIAAECGISPNHLEKIIAKMTNLSFKNYVAYLRTEIVCERLRSSHSSESAIAETCGFRTINEMEKYFQKFHRTTPFNYRKTQQIHQAQ